MGGFLSTPKPPPLPAPDPGPDPAEEERKRRLQMIERRRRGRAGTIVTSERGFLAPSGAGPGASGGAKNLLGE